jgi:hypothetical protein
MVFFRGDGIGKAAESVTDPNASGARENLHEDSWIGGPRSQPTPGVGNDIILVAGGRRFRGFGGPEGRGPTNPDRAAEQGDEGYDPDETSIRVTDSRGKIDGEMLRSVGASDDQIGQIMNRVQNKRVTRSDLKEIGLSEKQIDELTTVSRDKYERTGEDPLRHVTRSPAEAKTEFERASEFAVNSVSKGEQEQVRRALEVLRNSDENGRAWMFESALRDSKQAIEGEKAGDRSARSRLRGLALVTPAILKMLQAALQ